MIEAGPRPPQEPDLLFRGLGWGGDGWDDGSGDDWGWSGDSDDDDEEEGLPYRRSPVARAVALVTAAVVVVGSIGGWVADLAVSRSDPALVVGSIQPSTSSVVASGASGPTVAVEFSVTNSTARTTRANCRASVSGAGGLSRSGDVTTSPINPGASTRVVVVVPVEQVANGTPSVQATCLPVHPAG